MDVYRCVMKWVFFNEKLFMSQKKNVEKRVKVRFYF